MSLLPDQIDILLPRTGVRMRGLVSQPRSGAARRDVTLVFLHFFGGSSRSWRPVMNELAGEFPCVALDLRGSGRTDLAAGADEVANYGLDALVGDVTAALGQLRPGRYALVGHSMGGKVALAAAADHSGAPGLEALVLLAPSLATPEPMPDAERARLLAGHGSAVAVRETLSQVTAQELRPEVLQTALEDGLAVRAAAWRAWLERGSRQDISARLERVRVPVHLLAGEKDANMTPRLLRREIAAYLPEAFARDPETVSGAAHLLPLEAPGAVAAFIRRAL